ncbi:type II toxin-antitoxin system RelE/ParE family toxin [Methylorubrum rhodesianum]|jgi:phage-related protein|uniref:Type II toxin-antitoxin system RelE/ParE family toxin n=1 Tax=Methylorubrum rhodesianum TaxID=29427 RepID=A0ABU9ZHE2_9HYPH|nr:MULTISPECIES: type II toxin-antitoxin system RelE/ParE family toxin [Methylorubrum]MBY0139144.1 type II toxin-antitoxin system RelE/ParE family toxin [Methylorubrum populi]MRI54331.1 type II toxin-antitoxin system RelE/ParE family toxin [Methylobacterium sp. DB1607]MBB5761502.1 phage-related protein [Methylorubrum rhodesianum]MBI1687388.1 type II toxin-antitoxin system RelE/ParE family toxin [Methylorubrum sp. DB1722]MBK3405668.1 type II toxin-antitoxin system RelE/ParE family toxin [Methyl
MAAATAIPLLFYRSALGHEPVREWLRELPPEDKRVVGFDVRRVQLGWPIGLPVCRPMAGGLFEVRSTLPSRREARLLFGFHEGRLIALHAFIKKAQRTPASELELARRRLKEVMR